MKQEVKEMMKKEISIFEENIKAFEAGRIDKKTYKGISGGFGSYAQKNGGNMLRLRMTGGRLTKERLRFLAESIKEHQIDRIKMTTCQTIQLHNLNGTAVVDLMKKAIDADIITRGGGGDFPRNVMVSPLSGVEQKEYFDVLPWAEGAADYLISLIQSLRLPRKLKVAFSNSETNLTHATFRDLGFVAKADGTFDVYCAGGLGPNPKTGVKTAENVPAEDLIACIDAMIQIFTDYGNYENRGKARTRYLQDTLGIEGLKDAYQKALGEKLQTSQKLTVSLSETSKKGKDAISGSRITAQKQPGLYAVSYHPAGGMIPVHMPARLYNTIKDFEEVECRISPDGTLYIINLTAAEADAVLKATKGGAETPFEHSVSCIGASICQQGIRDSQALLAAMSKSVKEAALPGSALPRVYISGCPSSCGTHQIGVLGFQGAVKLINGRPEPAFALLFKGNQKRGEENLGTNLGTILESRIPEFIVELGKTVSESGLDFSQWIKVNESAFLGLAEKYM